MENTDAHWRQWGEFDPYRAALFYEKYRGACFGDNVREFFQTGEDYIDSLTRKLVMLYPGMRLGTAVDFGCGVGRLSIPLARRFERVIGVDVSPAMLNESRKNCSFFGISNAEFVPSDDSISRAPFGLQLVHSYLVLQHISVKRGLVIVRNLVDRLAPGGVCALHMPIDRDPSRLKKLAYFGKHIFPGSRCLWNVLQGKSISEPLMQINSYSIRALYEVIESAGLQEIWLLPLKGSHYSVVCFGRKRL
jgi:cyclopropane fatty-acyl-phospholipid synthase-like methyltransferase